MTAVLIEAADLNRLALEVTPAIENGLDAYGWAERERISMAALGGMFRSADRVFVQRVQAGVDPLDALTEIVGMTFWLAWEAHKEYGRSGS